MLSLTDEARRDAPASKSLHTLSVNNPRFAVHPLAWTSKHLRLLNITFQEVHETLDPAKLHGHDRKCRAVTAERMAEGSKVPYSSATDLVRPGSPLEAIGGEKHAFRYNHRVVCHLNIRASRLVKDVSGQTPELTIGFYRYDADFQRRRRSCPPVAPLGLNNSPGWRIREHLLRRTKPELWYNDPYLVCHLLTLAALQHDGWLKRNANVQCSELFLARLFVISDSDHTHAYVFKADISSQVIECFEYPTRSMEDVIFPNIRYTKVPFKPYSTFSERIILHLVGAEYASGFFDRKPISAAGSKKRKSGEKDQVKHKVKKTKAE